MTRITIDRAFALTNLLNAHERISVRRAMEELGIPKTSLYALLKKAKNHFPIRIDKGFIVRSG